jgi:3-methyladenine DNA glycosylase AlkD
MEKILEAIREDLRASANEKDRLSGERFFREEVRLYGMKSKEVIRISKEHHLKIKHLPKSEIFTLCGEFWKSGFFEEAVIACEWAYSCRKSFVPSDFAIFEKWVHLYVSNWAACDTLCNHTIGTFLEMYPEYLEKLKVWAGSPNRWARRAAAVSLIVPARKGKFVKVIFEIAQILLTDPDDMVQKGYGWMLKVTSQSDPDHRMAVFNFVMDHKTAMPRTALRYAIEKMEPELKKLAMGKET